MNGRPWTSAEIEALRLRHPHEPTAVIARDLKRPIRSVYSRAKTMRLGKTEAYYRQYTAGRTTGAIGAHTRFQSGNTPWNKGRKGWKAGGRAVETQFKPGRAAHEAHNYKPIGTLRVTHYGILERKVTDDPSIYPARRWQPVHRQVWEAAHGPVPKGHLVVFKPGMHTTVEAEITLDRLECISMRDNMRRNSVHNYPAELAEVTQLRAALTRKIRNREKAHEQDHQRPA